MTTTPDPRLELTDTQRALLDIEGKTWRYAGLKESAIRDATGLGQTAAMQVLNKLIDTEAALAYAPHTVKRLQRLRDQRQRSRPARRPS